MGVFTLGVGAAAGLAGIGGAGVKAIMGATALTGAATVLSQGLEDRLKGRISSAEAYLKAALEGSVIGALTGAVNVALPKGLSVVGQRLIEFGLGGTEEGLWQLMEQEELSPERMVKAGLFSVMGGELARRIEFRLGGGDGGSKTNQTLLSGEEWYRYFQDTYGADNVNWNVSSFDDMLKHPTSLRGYSADEIGQILGDGWTQSTYGSNGSGWKFIEDGHPDNMVFYHGGGGVHEGAYWGVKSGKTGTIKIVNASTYVPKPDDKATIIYGEDW